ncbi:hypothetical protein Leryth_003307 [Lithospermum erythrorhizon]|nr:hypothetical protein Leryth_003307 [Lithospermum erythrorhizon]
MHVGSGFTSKLVYGSGSFQIRMKTSNKPTNGVVTTFYLNNANYGEDSKPHDEVDFEIFGITPTLQTNVFASDIGQREQRFQLWFDPSKDFHSYTLLWNNQHILFTVDEIPIRVYKRVKGVNFPTTPMRIEASTWHATWAAGDVDWSKSPFISYYQGFDVTACSPPQNCASSELPWNKQKFMELSPKQLELMRTYRNKYMTYDYCNTTANAHPECKVNI